MRPVAQTFTINETDVEGIYLSAVNLYFAKKHPNFGVTIQIRYTDNGMPSPQIVEFSQVQLASSSVNVSADASDATKFEFNSLVYLKNGTYALVIIPDGGNDQYEAWVSKLSETDITTQLPIIKNNETGSFYLSGNDITWTPVIDEDLKFDLLRANFTSSSGTVTFSKRNIEYIKVKSTPPGLRRLFNDTMFCGTDDFISVLGIGTVSGTFEVGEVVYQYSGTEIIAKGVAYSANTTVLKLDNVQGTFTESGDIEGATSGATAQIISESQTVEINSATAVVTVPDASVFSVNDWIYFIDTSTNIAEINMVEARDLALNTITARTTPKGNDTNAIIGRIKGGNALGFVSNVANLPLNARYSGLTREALGYDIVVLTNSTANSTVNFANSTGQRLIGQYSGISTKIDSTINLTYDLAHFLFNDLIPRSTGVSYAFQGFADNNNFTEDADPIPFESDVNKEFNDTARVLMSRSNELTQLPVGREGDSSLSVFSTMSTGDSRISPAIDLRVSRSTFVHNFTARNLHLNGVYLVVEPTEVLTTDNIPTKYFSRFKKGASLEQASNTSITGTVFEANTTSITLIGGTNMTDFQVGQVVRNSANTDQRATILSVDTFNETLGNGITFFSRYVSKRVNLAEGLDSEDLKVYLTAYRPVNTDFHVYCKLLNSEDNKSFNSKLWTKMVPVHSAGLRSDLVNKEDFLELEYRMPESVQLHTANIEANTSSTTIICPSTAEIVIGDEIYLYDSNQNLFNVRKVRAINSATSLTVAARPSGNFGYSNTSMGVIENITYKQSAFRFTETDGVVRYCNEKDRVFETFKSFAIKIVPVSSSSHIVPRLRDMRALALQL